MKTYILLVACHNYSGSANYVNLAENRMRYLLHNNPSWANDANVEFYLFDVKEGKIKQNRFDGVRRDWVLKSSTFTPINKATHYNSHNFKIADTNVMSITDVYDFIIDLGKREPDSVQELTIIGHGWMGGPVLVNSYERSEYGPAGTKRFERDPWDKDARPKDGNEINMPTVTKWYPFYKAFKSDGYIWMWGCNFPKVVFKVLHQTVMKSGSNHHNMGDYKDDTVIKFSFTRSFAEEYYPKVPFFFPAVQADGKVLNADLKFTRTFKQVKDFCKAMTLNSYAGLFSYNTHIPVIAGMLGTYADYEKAPTPSRRRVMVVPTKKPPYSDNFIRIVQFYKVHLGLDEDPERRGYGIHTHAKMMAWWRELSGITP